MVSSIFLPPLRPDLPPVLMPTLRAIILAGIFLVPGCRLEDHTPAGSRLDEAQVREVILEFYRGLAAGDWSHVRTFFAPGGSVSYPLPAETDRAPGLAMVPADSMVLRWARLAGEESGAAGEARILRADFRQVDGVAAVWVTVNLELPWERRARLATGSEAVEHLVLHRTTEGWRIVLLSLPWIPR